MAKFKLSIFTPSSIIVKNLECESLLIPTTSGEINVLPTHTHMLTQIDTGILTAITNKSKRHFVMTTGVCKILGDVVTITSPTAELAQDIDVERAKSAESKASSRLNSAEPLTDVERIKFLRKLDRARSRIKAANLK